MLGVVDGQINYDVGGLQRSLAEDGQLGGVRVRSANNRVLLSGLVPDAPAQARVMLAVRFVEVERTAARDLSPGEIGTVNAVGLAGNNSISYSLVESIVCVICLLW